MHIEDKEKIGNEIEKIIYKDFLYSLNSKETRAQIAYKVKCFLEEEEFEWETLNVFTPAERVDKGCVDFDIDGEKFHFEPKYI
jgi:hypothetical protein